MEDILAAGSLSDWWSDFSGPVFLHSTLFEKKNINSSFVEVNRSFAIDLNGAKISQVCGVFSVN